MGRSPPPNLSHLCAEPASHGRVGIAIDARHFEPDKSRIIDIVTDGVGHILMRGYQIEVYPGPRLSPSERHEAEMSLDRGQSDTTGTELRRFLVIGK